MNIFADVDWYFAEEIGEDFGWVEQLDPIFASNSRILFLIEKVCLAWAKPKVLFTQNPKNTEMKCVKFF